MNDCITKQCDECGSSYFVDSSEMQSMCPECASILYGYEACPHDFDDGRCLRCNWDGSTSEYVKKLKTAKNNI